MARRGRACALLLLIAYCSSCSARQLTAAKQAAAAPPVVVAFQKLQPTLTSMWVPDVTADHPTVQVPVAGSPGTPTSPATMSRIRYTVTYTQRPAYVLQGSILIQAAAFSSRDGDTATYTLQTPNITIKQKGAAEVAQVPGQGIACSSYKLQPGSSVTCSFRARVFAFLDPPPPGSVHASVRVSGGFQSAAPVAIRTPVTAFEWPASNSTGTSSNMRLAAPAGASAEAAQQYLQDTMRSAAAAGSSGAGSSSDGGESPKQGSSAATVTNYFEPADGHVVPHGVEGKQPAANTQLQETAQFTYVALIPDIPRDSCKKALKVVNSATVEKTTDGLQLPETALCIVDIVPLGCDDTAAAAPATAAAPAAAPADASLIAQEAGAPAVAAVPAITSARPAVDPAAAAAAAQSDAAVVDVKMPPGVLMAAAGSKLCGAVGMCAPGQVCLDNLVCCDPGTTRCGNQCAVRGQACLGGSTLLPLGATVCASSFCTAGLSCLGGRCCGPDMPVCGAGCCAAGEACDSGVCVPRGGRLCGGVVCTADQQCVAPGVCCSAGQSQCGATCCPAGLVCLQGQCVAAGSHICAGVICGPGTVCSGSGVCCPAGSQLCGGTCCGADSSCVSGRCLPFGHHLCQGTVCTPDQVCSQGTCCNRGEQPCGAGTCCGAGLTCGANGLCVPYGAQPCGSTVCQMPSYCADPYRQLCCPSGQRACAGGCCPAGVGGAGVLPVVLEGGYAAGGQAVPAWGGAGGWGHAGPYGRPAAAGGAV